MKQTKILLKTFIPLNAGLIVVITIFYITLCLSKGGIVEIFDYYDRNQIFLIIIGIQIVFYIISFRSLIKNQYK
jgi:hypothetical protein